MSSPSYFADLRLIARLIVPRRLASLSTGDLEPECHDAASGHEYSLARDWLMLFACSRIYAPPTHARLPAACTGGARRRTQNAAPCLPLPHDHHDMNIRLFPRVVSIRQLYWSVTAPLPSMFGLKLAASYDLGATSILQANYRAVIIGQALSHACSARRITNSWPVCNSVGPSSRSTSCAAL